MIVDKVFKDEQVQIQASYVLKETHTFYYNISGLSRPDFLLHVG